MVRHSWAVISIKTLLFYPPGRRQDLSRALSQCTRGLLSRPIWRIAGVFYDFTASHIKVQSLHPSSLYNSSYFESYLRMHRLRQTQDCGEPGLPPGPTLQCGIAATCLLQNTFPSSPHSYGKAFRDHPDSWREKNVWTEYCLENYSRCVETITPRVHPESHQPMVSERLQLGEQNPWPFCSLGFLGGPGHLSLVPHRISLSGLWRIRLPQR